MGYARWFFAIDRANEAHPLTAAVAGHVFAADFRLPYGIPSHDAYGVLIAEIVVRLDNRVPVEMERISLLPLPSGPTSLGKPVAPVTAETVNGLRRALRMKIRRGRVQRLGFSEDAACDELEQRIAAGDSVGLTYQDRLNRMRAAVDFLDGKGAAP